MAYAIEEVDFDDTSSDQSATDESDVTVDSDAGQVYHEQVADNELDPLPFDQLEGAAAQLEAASEADDYDYNHHHDDDDDDDDKSHDSISVITISDDDDDKSQDFISIITISDDDDEPEHNHNDCVQPERIVRDPSQGTVAPPSPLPRVDDQSEGDQSEDDHPIETDTSDYDAEDEDSDADGCPYSFPYPYSYPYAYPYQVYQNKFDAYYGVPDCVIRPSFVELLRKVYTTEPEQKELDKKMAEILCRVVYRDCPNHCIRRKNKPCSDCEMSDADYEADIDVDTDGENTSRLPKYALRFAKGEKRPYGE